MDEGKLYATFDVGAGDGLKVALAKMPPGIVDGLLKDIPKLSAILKYQVLAGKDAGWCDGIRCHRHSIDAQVSAMR